MIHLCYLKKKVHDQEEFYDIFLTSIFPYASNTDLIITDVQIRQKPGLNIRYYGDVDLEELAFQKIDNIFLTEFDDIESKFISNLIAMKSKRSEIIGISNSYNDKFKNLQLDTQSFLDNGFTLDQLSIALILKNNLPSDLVKTYTESPRCKTKHLNVKEIDDISEIIKFIKK
jgi:hypothetical protein